MLALVRVSLSFHFSLFIRTRKNDVFELDNVIAGFNGAHCRLFGQTQPGLHKFWGPTFIKAVVTRRRESLNSGRRKRK